MLTAKERIQDLADGFVDDHCEECDTWCPMAMVLRWQDRNGFNAWTIHCMNCGAEWNRLTRTNETPGDTEYDGMPEVEREWEDGGDDWDDFTPGREEL